MRLRTRSRTATAGADLDRVARRVTIRAGRLRTRVRIPVARDRTDEHAERFEVTLDRPRGVRIDRDTATSRITDVDPPPRVRGESLTVTEPSTEPASAVVSLVLSRPSAKEIRLVVAGRNGTADRADFRARRTVALVPPGSTQVKVEVTLLPDDVEEAEETFTVEVLRARQARTGRAATVTILPAEPGSESSSKTGVRSRSPST